MNAAPVALVTGGARGIGAAAALRLAADGYHVAIACREAKSHARETLAALEKQTEAVLLEGDLADPDVPQRLVDGTVEAFGGLDALVNNAGNVVVGGLEDADADAFDRQFAVNARAPFLLCKAALPHLARSAQEGRTAAIVNVSSLNGSRVPSFGAPLYSASKAALNMLTVALAPSLAEHGVRINAVEPGATETEMFLANANDEARAHFIDRAAMGRLGKPDEVATVIAFLLSADAGWMTGEVVSASGGTR